MAVKRQKFLVPLSLFLFLIISCSQNDNLHLLFNDWYFSIEENPEKFELFDGSQIKSLYTFFPDAEGVIFLKTEFSTPVSWKNQMLSLFLGRMEIADKAYLNGQLIGETGSFPPKWYNDWNIDRQYDIPPSMINWGGTNELFLKIYVNRSGLIDGDIQIGPKKKIDEVYKLNSLFHRYINILFSFLLLFFGVNSLLLYTKRKQDRQIFWFALVSVTFALSQAGIFLSSIPGFDYSRISYIPFMKVIGVLEILTAYFFLLFTQSFFKRNENRFLSLLLFTPSLFFTIAYLLQVNYKPFNFYYNAFEISLSIPSLYINFLVIRACFDKKKGAITFLSALLPASLLIIHDMLLTNLIEGYILMLTGISLPLLLIIFNIIYGLDLVKDRNKAEVLNMELDKTIHRHLNELEDVSTKHSHLVRRKNFVNSFSLSTREKQILGFIIDGKTNDEIAEILNISIRTVSAHLYKIYRKTSLHSRTEVFAAFTKDVKELKP